MTTNDFETYDSYPTTPLRDNRENYENPPRAPMRMRRPPNIRMSLLEHKIIDTEEKYLKTQFEIENLKMELLNIRNENEDKRHTIKVQTDDILSYKFRLNKIHDIIFENSEKIPEWIYIQIMNSLVMSR
tara:strand:- start:226 stop:612 length:387 start_codon:yes stop_codon:yes gene_type:complete